MKGPGSISSTAGGAFGTSQRTGAIRLPGLENVDFGLNKQFRFRERARVELGAKLYF